MQEAALKEEIIGCAMRVHQTLGPGFLESVYHKSLAHELSKAEAENSNMGAITSQCLDFAVNPV